MASNPPPPSTATPGAAVAGGGSKKNRKKKNKSKAKSDAAQAASEIPAADGPDDPEEDDLPAPQEPSIASQPILEPTAITEDIKSPPTPPTWAAPIPTTLPHRAVPPIARASTPPPVVNVEEQHTDAASQSRALSLDSADKGLDEQETVKVEQAAIPELALEQPAGVEVEEVAAQVIPPPEPIIEPTPAPIAQPILPPPSPPSAPSSLPATPVQPEPPAPVDDLPLSTVQPASNAPPAAAATTPPSPAGARVTPDLFPPILSSDSDLFPAPTSTSDFFTSTPHPTSPPQPATDELFPPASVEMGLPTSGEPSTEEPLVRPEEVFRLSGDTPGLISDRSEGDLFPPPAEEVADLSPAQEEEGELFPTPSPSQDLFPTSDNSETEDLFPPSSHPETDGLFPTSSHLETDILFPPTTDPFLPSNPEPKSPAEAEESVTQIEDLFPSTGEDSFFAHAGEETPLAQPAGLPEAEGVDALFAGTEGEEDLFGAPGVPDQGDSDAFLATLGREESLPAEPAFPVQAEEGEKAGEGLFAQGGGEDDFFASAATAGEVEGKEEEGLFSGVGNVEEDALFGDEGLVTNPAGEAAGLFGGEEEWALEDDAPGTPPAVESAEVSQSQGGELDLDAMGVPEGWVDGDGSWIWYTEEERVEVGRGMVGTGVEAVYVRGPGVVEEYQAPEPTPVAVDPYVPVTYTPAPRTSMPASTSLPYIPPPTQNGPQAAASAYAPYSTPQLPPSGFQPSAYVPSVAPNPYAPPVQPYSAPVAPPAPFTPYGNATASPYGQGSLGQRAPQQVAKAPPPLERTKTSTAYDPPLLKQTKSFMRPASAASNYASPYTAPALPPLPQAPPVHASHPPPPPPGPPQGLRRASPAPVYQPPPMTGKANAFDPPSIPIARPKSGMQAMPRNRSVSEQGGYIANSPLAQTSPLGPSPMSPPSARETPLRYNTADSYGPAAGYQGAGQAPYESPALPMAPPSAPAGYLPPPTGTIRRVPSSLKGAPVYAPPPPVQHLPKHAGMERQMSPRPVAPPFVDHSRPPPAQHPPARSYSEQYEQPQRSAAPPVSNGYSDQTMNAAPPQFAHHPPPPASAYPTPPQQHPGPRVPVTPEMPTNAYGTPPTQLYSSPGMLDASHQPEAVEEEYDPEGGSFDPYEAEEARPTESARQYTPPAAEPEISPYGYAQSPAKVRPPIGPETFSPPPKASFRQPTTRFDDVVQTQEWQASPAAEAYAPPPSNGYAPVQALQTAPVVIPSTPQPSQYQAPHQHGSFLGYEEAGQEAQSWQDQADDQYAANSLSGSYQPSNVVERKSLEEDPLERSLPNSRRVPNVSFTAHGQIVVVFQPSEEEDEVFANQPITYGSGSSISRKVMIRPFGDLVPTSAISSFESKFPGPLLFDGPPKGSAAEKKKKEAVRAFIESSVKEMETGLPYLSTNTGTSILRTKQEAKIVLMRMIQLLIDSDGRALASDPKLLNQVKDVFLLKQGESFGISPGLYTGMALGQQKPVGEITAMTSEQSSRLSDLIIRGEKRDAVQHCIESGSWSHALIISSSIGPEVWKQTVDAFISKTLEHSGSPSDHILKTAYSIFGASGKQALDAVLPDGAAVSSLGPTLEKWQDIACTIIANSTVGDVSALSNLGDKLKAGKLIEAAHVCYLLSPQQSRWDATLAALKPKVTLFGHSDDASGGDALIFSELIEYAYSFVPTAKGQEAFAGIPHLLPYKLAKAWEMLEAGEPKDAQSYCDAITSSLRLSKAASAPSQAGLIHKLQELTERLSGEEKLGSLTQKLNKPNGTDSFGSWFEGRLTKFIAGEETTESTPAEPVKEIAKPATTPNEIGPFSHYSAISAESVPPLSRQTSAYDLNVQPSSQGYEPGNYRSGSAMAYRPPYQQNTYDRPASAMSQRTAALRSSIPNEDPLPVIITPPPPRDEVASPADPSRRSSSNSSLGEQINSALGAQIEIPSWGQSYEFDDSAAPIPEDGDDDGEGFINPMSAFGAPMAYSREVTPALESSTPVRGQEEEDEDDDDLGLGNGRKKVKEETEEGGGEEKEEKSGGKAPVAAAAAASGNDQKPAAATGSWIGRWFSKKEGTTGPVRAKLGEETSMYYDKEAKRWVTKGEAPSAAPTPPPPPPTRAQTASPSQMNRSTPGGRATSEPPSGPPPGTSTPPPPGGAPPLRRQTSSLAPSPTPPPPSAGPSPLGADLMGVPPQRKAAGKKKPRYAPLDITAG